MTSTNNESTAKTRRTRLHFTCDVFVHELNALPYVSGFYFIKWKVISGSGVLAGDAAGGGAGAVAGVRDWRMTHRATVRSHTVAWNSSLVPGDGDHPGLELSIGTDRDGVLLPCELLLVIKQEANGGRSADTVGSVVVNLSELATFSKPTTRRYLLQEAKVNSTLKVSVTMKLTKGAVSEFKIPKPSLKNGNIITAIAEDMFSATPERALSGNGSVNVSTTDQPSRGGIEINILGRPEQSESPTRDLADDKAYDMSFYDETDDIRIVEETFARRSFSPFFTGGKTALVQNIGGKEGDFVIASVDKDLNVLNIASGNVDMTVSGTADEVTCFAVKPDGKHLVSATRSLLLSLVDLSDGTVVRSWKAHEAPVLAMAFDKSSTLVATGSADSTIRVWDVDRGYATHLFKGHSGVISALTFFNGKSNNILLASASDDCKVRIWDLKTKKCVSVLDNHVSVVRGVAFSVDGRYLLSGGRDKILNVWEVSSGELIKTIPTYEAMESIGLVSEISRIGLEKKLGLDECSMIAYSGGEKGVIRLWNIDTGDCIATQKSETNSSYEITDVLLRPKSQDIVAVTSDHNLLFYNMLEDLTLTHQIVGYNEEIVDICFVNPNESSLAVASNSKQIKIMDLESSNCDILKHLKSSREPLKLKSSYTFQAHEKDINSIAVAPNDKIFATGSQDKTAKIWSTTDGSLVGTLKGHRRGIWSVQFSTVDQVLVTSSGDKTIKLWSMTDYTCVKTLEGHLNSVLKVSFISLGMQMVSCGSDGLVKLWNIKNNECIETFDGHEDKVWALAVKRDESLVVSGGADSKITIWEDCTAAEREEQDRETNEKVEKEQDLMNFLKKKDYKNAIILAMELDKPMRLLTLFKQLDKARLHPASATGLYSVDEVVKGLDKEQLEKLLKYIRDWNTHSKHASIAQLLLHLILNNTPSEDLFKTHRIKELLDSLLVYSERHYVHVDEMLKKSYLISYTLDRMDDLIGGAGDVEMEVSQ
ncbi:Transducin (beta)-like 3 [Chytriomyces hyalinus]|nr:Transducin (beta)-like 3 [Chytriomyces hyalinus]